MDRNLIELTNEDINLTIIENNILLQTTGNTDVIFEKKVMDTLIQEYLNISVFGVKSDEACGCGHHKICGCGDNK